MWTVQKCLHTEWFLCIFLTFSVMQDGMHTTQGRRIGQAVAQTGKAVGEIQNKLVSIYF